MTTVSIGSGGVTPADVLAVARGDARIELAPEAQEAMAASAAIVQQLAGSERPVYGVSTGFGSLATTPIPAERREELQQRLLRSHAAGMGEPVEREVVRAMFFLRVRSLAMGRSGTRPAVAETMVGLLNAGITPVVPEHGSLGASGDLVPLAHCALVVIGEGEVVDPGGRRRPAGEALAEAGVAPLRLTAKEGLALINGTDGALGMLVLALRDFEALLRVADIAAAMSVEAVLGTDRAFAADLQALRPHAGQGASAANLRRLLEGSGDRRKPSRERPARPGRILAALLAAGPRRRAGCGGPRRARGGDRARLRNRQPDDPPRRPGRVVLKLPRRTGRVRV